MTSNNNQFGFNSNLIRNNVGSTGQFNIPPSQQFRNLHNSDIGKRGVSSQQFSFNNNNASGGTNNMMSQRNSTMAFTPVPASQKDRSFFSNPLGINNNQFTSAASQSAPSKLSNSSSISQSNAGMPMAIVNKSFGVERVNNMNNVPENTFLSTGPTRATSNSSIIGVSKNFTVQNNYAGGASSSSSTSTTVPQFAGNIPNSIDLNPTQAYLCGFKPTQVASGTSASSTSGQFPSVTSSVRTNTTTSTLPVSINGTNSSNYSGVESAGAERPAKRRKLQHSQSECDESDRPMVQREKTLGRQDSDTFGVKNNISDSWNNVEGPVLNTNSSKQNVNTIENFVGNTSSDTATDPPLSRCDRFPHCLTSTDPSTKCTFCRIEGICKLCGKPMEFGDCISKPDGRPPWRHTKCPQVKSKDLLKVILKQFVPHLGMLCLENGDMDTSTPADVVRENPASDVGAPAVSQFSQNIGAPPPVGGFFGPSQNPIENTQFGGQPQASKPFPNATQNRVAASQVSSQFAGGGNQFNGGNNQFTTATNNQFNGSNNQFNGGNQFNNGGNNQFNNNNGAGDTNAQSDNNLSQGFSFSQEAYFGAFADDFGAFCGDPGGGYDEFCGGPAAGDFVNIPEDPGPESANTLLYTDEQKEFLDYVPQPGDVIRGNARAGSGKTTIAALLCDTILNRDPSAKIAYFVFGKPAQQDALKKIDGSRVCVETSHAFAMRLVFDPKNLPANDVNNKFGSRSGIVPNINHRGGSSSSTNGFLLQNKAKIRIDSDIYVSTIEHILGLRNKVHARLDQYAEQSGQPNLLGDTKMKQAKKRKTIVSRIGQYVKKTLLKFYSSKDDCIKASHINWRALPDKNSSDSGKQSTQINWNKKKHSAAAAAQEWRKAFDEEFYILNCTILFQHQLDRIYGTVNGKPVNIKSPTPIISQNLQGAAEAAAKSKLINQTPIVHDAYLKVLQLRKINLGPDHVPTCQWCSLENPGKTVGIHPSSSSSNSSYSSFKENNVNAKVGQNIPGNVAGGSTGSNDTNTKFPTAPAGNQFGGGAQFFHSTNARSSTNNTQRNPVINPYSLFSSATNAGETKQQDMNDHEEAKEKKKEKHGPPFVIPDGVQMTGSETVADLFVCPRCDRKQNRCCFDYILVDEAQDLTPCQAAAFWDQPSAVVYLLGDYRQRMYAWRYAGRDFESFDAQQEFGLTNSFRFGVNIARVATRVLQHSGKEVIRGYAQERGWIKKDDKTAKYIICRSNKGIKFFVVTVCCVLIILIRHNTVHKMRIIQSTNPF